MEKNKTQLENKVAVITGGSSGIGKACMEMLAAEGAHTINLDIQKPVKQAPHFISCDVSLKEDIARASSAIFNQFGAPDILVSCAGVGVHEKLFEGDPDKWEKVVQVNIMGTLRFMRAFTGQMMERKSGDIVFMSSVAASQAYEYGGIYAATKAAIALIAETLRMETAPFLRVLSIAPGLVETAFLESEVSGPRQLDEWKALSPSEVADVLKYVLSAPKNVSLNHVALRSREQYF